SAKISGGVFVSLPSQNGQNEPPGGGRRRPLKSSGRWLRSVAMITQRRWIGSLRSSDIGALRVSFEMDNRDPRMSAHHLLEVSTVRGAGSRGCPGTPGGGRDRPDRGGWSPRRPHANVSIECGLPAGQPHEGTHPERRR